LVHGVVDDSIVLHLDVEHLAAHRRHDVGELDVGHLRVLSLLVVVLGLDQRRQLQLLVGRSSAFALLDSGFRGRA
jgi:hypothetical protein